MNENGKHIFTFKHAKSVKKTHLHRMICSTLKAGWKNLQEIELQCNSLQIRQFRYISVLAAIGSLHPKGQAKPEFSVYICTDDMPSWKISTKNGLNFGRKFALRPLVHQTETENLSWSQLAWEHVQLVLHYRGTLWFHQQIYKNK